MVGLGAISHQISSIIAIFKVFWGPLGKYVTPSGSSSSNLAHFQNHLAHLAQSELESELDLSDE